MKKTIFALFGLGMLAVGGIMFSILLLANFHRAAPKSPQGISANSILIGTSLPLSGYVSFFGEYQFGGQSYFNEVNDAGGINGRKIKTIVYDDQYVPALTVMNTQKLIRDDKVFALFNYVGTPTGIKALPLINEAKIPLVGVGTGAEVFRNPLQPYVFNLRASYHQEAEAFIKGVVEDLKMTKIAVFYQFDDYGFDGLKGAELALAKYGLKPTVTASYRRGTLDVEEAADIISKDRPEAIFMVSVYAPASKFIKLVKNGSYSPVFGNLSFVGSEALAEQLGSSGDGVIVTQVVPAQEEKSILNGVDRYIAALKKYFPDKKPTFSGLEGYLNAEILVEGLERSGRDLTREKLVKSLETISKFSLDVASSVSYSNRSHQGMNRVYLTYIKDGKFNLFSDWQEYKESFLANR